MPMTTRQITDLLTAPPATGVRRGELMFRQASITGNRARHGTPAERALLRHLIEAAEQIQLPHAPAHPDDHPELQAGDGDRSLSASDVAWLSALPSDPAQITLDDARVLAGMARQVKAPGDVRLINSKWTPVRDRYDRVRAEHRAAMARSPWPRLDERAAADAIAEAIRADNPVLAANDEAVGAAVDTVLRDVLAARRAAHDAAVEAAQRNLDRARQPVPV